MYYRGVCSRCVLADRLTDALNDGTGRINPTLQPLFDHLAAMPRPRTGILWLSKPPVLPMLHALAHNEVPLTHDGLDKLPQPYRSVAHLRQHLVAAGLLPPFDKTLRRATQWTTQFLAE